MSLLSNSSDASSSARRARWLIFVGVFAIAMAFAAFTQHAWEDYYITYRVSKNLATGHGLVYTVGERVHVFTSPLNVLLPAALSTLTGNTSDQLVLWLFRVLSSALVAGAAVLLYESARRNSLSRLATAVLIGMFAFDAKIVDFSINGMETGLLVFFLALAIHGLVVTRPRQMLRIGVGWAGLMWTRPDSCVYIAILGAGVLFFLSGRTGGKSRIEWGKMLLGAGLVCAALYVSWFLWAWWYYGSPIPHTITAKAANRPPILFAVLVTDLVMFPLNLLTPLASSLQFTFLPGYSDHGGWHISIVAVSYALGLPAAFAWLIPGVRPQTRLFSLACFLGNFFLTAVLGYFPPWYLPTVAVFGYLTIGLFFDQVLCLTSRLSQLGWARRWCCHLPKVLRVSAVGLVMGQAAVTVCVARQLQVQQELIENGLRHPIGLWLRDHAQTSHDTVMLEPLGYIGYYSGLKMLDCPGLASKEVVEVRKRLGPYRENRVGLELKPDWLVLRPWESRGGAFIDTGTLQKFYNLVRVFDATDKVNATRWLPGRPYVQFDQTFLIFHRKPDAGPKPPASGIVE